MKRLAASTQVEMLLVCAFSSAREAVGETCCLIDQNARRVGVIAIQREGPLQVLNCTGRALPCELPIEDYAAGGV